MKRLVKHVHHRVRTHYHEKYHARYAHLAHWIFVFDSVLVGIVLALLGTGAYFAFIYHPLRDDFRFEIVTPEKMVAGRETEVKLLVSNRGERRLHNARIWAHLPDHFRISQYPEGYDPETKATPIGVVAPGKTAELSMRGVIFGPPTEELIYVHMLAADDKGAPDEKIFPIRIGWNENLFGLDVELPNAVLDGQAVRGRIRVVNGTDLGFEDVRVRPTWPEGFSLLTTSPPVKGGEFVVGPLASGEQVYVEIYGRWRGKADSFEASAEAWSPDAGPNVILARATARRGAAQPNLAFTVETASASPVAAGEDVPFTLRYRNAGSYVLKDVRFAVPLDTRLAEQKSSFVEFEPLAELAPGASGELRGSVRVRPALSPYVTDPKLALTPAATFSIPERNVVDSTVTGPSVERKVRGGARIVAAARYTTAEGDQIGRGPMPPRVGKETRTWIFVSLETTSSAVEGGRMEIRLPEGVRWTGRASVSLGETLDHDPERRVVSWNLGAVPAHAGESTDAALASFEVALTPTSDQIGTEPALLDGVSFNGKDAWTGEAVSAAQSALKSEKVRK